MVLSEPTLDPHSAAIEDLKALFALFDLNGDGVITALEAEQVLAALAGIVTVDEACDLR